MTAVGGLVLLGHGATESSDLIPESPAQWMGAIATALSFINIVGGFLVSGKMLDLFRRPTDPQDYFELYAIPVGLILAGLGAAAFAGIGNLGIMSGSVAIASAICCIAAIAGLANQKTARTGNVLGMTGVAFGVAATAGGMAMEGASVTAFEQAGLLGGIGASVGTALASGVGPTELPQTVAAFHSLVGLAAMAGAAGEFLDSGDLLGAGTLTAIYLATFIGGVTFAGSVVAFGKLSEMMSSAPFQLPGRDAVNLGLLGLCVAGLVAFLNPAAAAAIAGIAPGAIQLGSLALAAAVSSVLGFLLVAAISGADTPVVITGALLFHQCDEQGLSRWSLQNPLTYVHSLPYSP